MQGLHLVLSRSLPTMFATVQDSPGRADIRSESPVYRCDACVSVTDPLIHRDLARPSHVCATKDRLALSKPLGTSELP